MDGLTGSICRDPIISYQVHNDGDVTYKSDGQAVLRDDSLSIETGLRLAQQKFGSTLVLSGSQDFQKKAAVVADEAGLNARRRSRSHEASLVWSKHSISRRVLAKGLEHTHLQMAPQNIIQ